VNEAMRAGAANCTLTDISSGIERAYFATLIHLRALSVHALVIIISSCGDGTSSHFWPQKPQTVSDCSIFHIEQS